MATDATDKLLVASVLERGKRDMDGDTVQPEQEDEIGAPRNFGVAGELECAVADDFLVVEHHDDHVRWRLGNHTGPVENIDRINFRRLM